MSALPYEALHDRLWTYVRRRVDSDADADDVTQDVFLRMHERLDQLDADANVAGWAYAIARNTVVDHHRRRRPVELTDEPVAPPPEDDTSPATQVAQWLAAALPDIPEPYRQALELTDLGGMSQAEAAAKLGLSASGMRTRVQRGRKRLREVLDACCSVQLDRRKRVIECRSRQQECC